MDQFLNRLDKIASRMEKALSGSGRSGGSSDDSKSDDSSPRVADYDDYYDTFVQPFVDTCRKIKGIEHMGDMAETCFKHQRKVIAATSSCKEPSATDLQKFVQTIIDQIKKADVDARKYFKKDALFGHHKAFIEILGSFNWLFSKKPQPVVQGQLEASDFYFNMVLKNAKDLSDPDKSNHRAFVKQAKEMLAEEKLYVKKHHMVGLNWNKSGGSLPSSSGSSSAASGSTTKAKPKPAIGGGAGKAALFAQLSKGGAVTKGLKRVTKDMKTKNRKDRSGVVKAVKKNTTVVKKAKKPASLYSRQGTWFCENYWSENITIDKCSMKENVYVYDCNNAVITIKGKVKSVSVDKCKKTTIIVDSVISTFEAVNSQSIKVWVRENCPSIAIDKTAGCQLILSKDCIKNPPLIITSSISEMNISLPGADENSDPVEFPVPEQYQTTIDPKNKTIKTIEVKHG